MTDPIILGHPDRAETEEALRGGALVFRSRHGVRATERLLIEALPERAPARFLTGHDPEGSVALAARALWGDACAVTWWHLDAYVGARARRTLERNGAGAVEVVVSPDLPGVAVPGEPAPAARPGFDLVALPFPRGQEAQLGRELIEEAHDALVLGGRLLASNGDRRGDWVKRVLREVTGNATVAHDGGRRKGLTAAARRTRARPAVRDHQHEIAVTLRGRELRFTGRPGVFGFRGLDQGTRALAAAALVSPGQTIIDIGCGYGALGLSVATEARPGRVALVDSNARAVALATRNARANGTPEAEVLLRADLEDVGEGAFDVALANPPYFGNWRVAGAFVDAAARALKTGGVLWLVAKAHAQHADLMRERFDDVRVDVAKSGHGVITGRRRASRKGEVRAKVDPDADDLDEVDGDGDEADDRG